MWPAPNCEPAVVRELVPFGVWDLGLGVCRRHRVYGDLGTVVASAGLRISHRCHPKQLVGAAENWGIDAASF